MAGNSRSKQSETINRALKNHQSKLNDWDKQAKVKTLLTWIDRFILEFKLQVETPALTLERLRITTGGHFLRGRNGFGLVNEIAINEIYYRDNKIWEPLATLLHELLHAEQENGKNSSWGNYHNKQFREKAGKLGLIVDQQGYTMIAKGPTPFREILLKYDIQIPEEELTSNHIATPLQGTSKLKLWICSCTPKPVKVRVAIPDFQARCLKCGEQFIRKE